MVNGRDSYVICDGAGLAACAECRRHVDRHRGADGAVAQVFNLQPRLEPRVGEGSCVDYQGPRS